MQIKSILIYALLLTGCRTGNLSGGSETLDTTTTPAPAASVVSAQGKICQTFEDHTAKSNLKRQITWDRSLQTVCWTIKQGQSITWTGTFDMHPIYSTDRVTGTPLPNRGLHKGNLTDDTFEGVFAVPGIFGFACENHSSMTGEIRVIP